MFLGESVKGISLDPNNLHRAERLKRLYACPMTLHLMQGLSVLHRYVKRLQAKRCLAYECIYWHALNWVSFLRNPKMVTILDFFQGRYTT